MGASDYAALRAGAQSLPELSSKGGFDRFRNAGASRQSEFDGAMAETMAQLSFGPSSERPPSKRASSADRRNKKPPAKAGRRAAGGRKTAPSSSLKAHKPDALPKADRMAATYDRERTPDGVNPQLKLASWSSWQLTQVKETGEVVCAATSFDPPWKATEDREGAVFNFPGYHHSAVGHLSASEIRNDRAKRRLDVASGKKIVPVLESSSAPKGPAERRREYFKMDFQNRILDKSPAYLHAAAGQMTPAEMRKQRETMPDWEARHGVGGDALAASVGHNHMKFNTTATHWRKPGNLGGKAEAAQRVNILRFEDKPGAEFGGGHHPGPVNNAHPVAGMTPAQLRSERGHRKENNAATAAARREFLAQGGAKDHVDMSKSGRFRKRQENGWRGPTEKPAPVYIEDMTV